MIFVYRYKLSEAHKCAKALNRMTDHIILDIFYNIEGKFKEAKELLCRILKRDLYTILDSKNFSAELLVKNICIVTFITQHEVQNYRTYDDSSINSRTNNMVAKSRSKPKQQI